jgi:BolA protein
MSSSQTAKKIETKIRAGLAPIYFSILDETWKHAGHAGAITGKGHFAIQVVSEQFEGQSRLNRHRMVFDILREEMETAIHALSIQAETPTEWETQKAFQGS